MTIDNFLNLINVEEVKKNEAIFYLTTKGVVIHEYIYKYLINSGINKETITWEDIADELRQDKNIRYQLYIFIATLEEYIRAYISNKYEENRNQDFWLVSSISRNNIKENINQFDSVYFALSEADFGTLIKQVYKLPSLDKKILFPDIDEDKIKENLNAVVELRNVVSHHKFLKTCNDLKECTVQGVQDKTLLHNIKNLRLLLPNEYRYGKNKEGGITGAMIKCKFSLD